MPSPLLPTFQKSIYDESESITRDRVDPWLHLSHSGVHLKTFDGRAIEYQGVHFLGTPSQIFWSRYIEPFLEDFVLRQLALAVRLSKERELDGRELIGDIRPLLKQASAKVFSRMADVDRRLMSGGFPDSRSLRDTKLELSQIERFIDSHCAAEVLMWHQKPRLQIWYERNSFWVWVTTTLVTVALALIALVK